MEKQNIGFNNEEEIDEFREMISEHPPYQDIEILNVSKRTGPEGNDWWDVRVDISSVFPGRHFDTFVNDTEGNWDVFLA